MSTTSIYVSENEALAVILGGSAKNPKISRVERLEFSSHAFDEEGNPHDPETVSDLRALELKQWVKDQGLGGKGIATLDSSDVIFRDIFVEFTDRRQIDKVIRYQVEGVIPSEPIDDLCVGYVVDEVSERGSRLTIAAARRRKVRTLVDDLDFAGVKAMQCDSTIGGILNLRSHCPALSNVDTPTVWIDLQDDVALLAVLEGESILSYRALHIPDLNEISSADAPGVHVPPPIPGVDPDEDDEVQTHTDAHGETHLARSEAGSLAEYPEEVANLETLINLLKIEIRRASIAVRASKPVANLIITGASEKHHDELASLGELTGLSLSFESLIENLYSGKSPLPDSLLIAATAGVGLVGLGDLGTGIDYLSGDLAPASTFDYVKWPIAFTLMVMVMCLGFMFVIALKEPAQLDAKLIEVERQKKVGLAAQWAKLKRLGGEHFKEDFPEKEGKGKNSAMISAVHRILESHLSTWRAGNKGNYPPIYPSEEVLASLLNVIDMTVGSHPGAAKDWHKDGKNQNFALSKITISQKITRSKTEGTVDLELYLDRSNYNLPRKPAPGSEPDLATTARADYFAWLKKKALHTVTNNENTYSEPFLIQAALKELKFKNPAWDGTDPASEFQYLVAHDTAQGTRPVELKIGPDDKKAHRGERLFNGSKVDVFAHKVEFNFALRPVAKNNQGGKAKGRPAN